MVQPTVSPESAAASCSASLRSIHVVNAADVLTEYDNVTGTFTIPRLVATPGAAWRFSHWLVSAHVYMHETFPQDPDFDTEFDESFEITSNPSEDIAAHGEHDYTITLGADRTYTARRTFTAIAAVFVASLPHGPILCNRSGVLVCNSSGSLLWH